MAGEAKTFKTAAKRWESIGPYYAMFPIRFADAVVRKYTKVGDTILDPFAGRGTAVFSAAANERIGFGIEVSPVGWVYAKAKLAPAALEDVECRLKEIESGSRRFDRSARDLPKFFSCCFSSNIRRFLLAARRHLNWCRNRTDRTLMAFLLVYLHGKTGQALSNQMRQTKAFSPTYAVKWWAERELRPPKMDPVDFMLKRIRWRYTKGILENGHSRIYLGDSLTILPVLKSGMKDDKLSRAQLLLTSPPYYGVTNYYYDQWLRLWLLGFENRAYVSRGRHRGRFANREAYQRLLSGVFLKAAQVLRQDAVVYVRTSKEKVTYEATLNALSAAFPRKGVVTRRRPFRKPTQTHLFGDTTPKPGEVDIIMTP